jgi:hypothetical protein
VFVLNLLFNHWRTGKQPEASARTH